MVSGVNVEMGYKNISIGVAVTMLVTNACCFGMLQTSLEVPLNAL
jgi:hypothetical protein